MTDRPAPVAAPAVPATRAPMVHWAVDMNRRNRTWAFAMMAVIVGWHQLAHDQGLAMWLALVSSFLIYPQLAWLTARRATQPLRAEVLNLRLDSTLLGAWIGFMGFPAWIGFALFTATQLNLMLFRGVRGMLLGSLLFLASAALSAWVFNARWQPDTTWEVTLLCQIGLLAYLMTVAHEAHQRSVKLSLARRALRDNAASLHLQLSEIKALQSLLRDQANRDALTGLYNRRYLDSTIDRELARCLRDQAPLSVMLLDVDHFKGVNDQHGHQTGDDVLRRLGETLRQEARASDVVCRYGGEEFLLLLPGMDRQQALKRAEQLRQLFGQDHTDTATGKLQVTLSIGVACYPEHGRTPTELLCHADEALYRAKHQGRNRVELYTSDPAAD